MSVWGRIFARLYDRVMARTEQAGLGAHRHALLASAEGDVLEIGAGTGVNLQYYGEGVRTLTMTEPEEPMVRRLRKRLEEVRPGTKLVSAPAEDLPFADDTFDTVVTTLVLCTVDDQAGTLRELGRVLRPGGRLLFIEHVRSENPRVARLQHGCECNRQTLAGIRSAGFHVRDVGHDSLKHAPPWVRPLIVGVAELSGQE